MKYIPNLELLKLDIKSKLSQTYDYYLQIFHTDRCSEFNNYLLDDMPKAFNIQRSLSAKGCPYDNAVAEAQFKIIKTEFKQALL